MVKFGHDGWHGLLADEVVFSTIGRLAQIAGSLMTRDSKLGARMIVGYDRRFLSDLLAKRICEDLAATGIDCILLDRPITSGGVAVATAAEAAATGMMVTGGNLPSEYSGLKLFAADGGSLPRWLLDQIEDAFADGVEIESVLRPASMVRVDPVEQYFDSLRSILPIERIRVAGITFAVDAMWGASSGLLPSLIDGSGSRCVEIHATHNPLFPELLEPRPGLTTPHRLRTIVTSGDAAFGVVISADGSELSVIDEHGRDVSPSIVGAVLADYLLSRKNMARPLARLITSSTCVDEIARIRGVLSHEVAIGHPAESDAVRDLEPALLVDDAGGYILGNHIPERDAIAVTLAIAAAIIETGSPLSELVAGVEQVCGRRALQLRSIVLSDHEVQHVQVRLAESEWPDMIADQIVQSRYVTDGLRLELENDDWLLLRYDEFERSLQIVAESEDVELAVRLVEFGRALIFD